MSWEVGTAIILVVTSAAFFGMGFVVKLNFFQQIAAGQGLFKFSKILQVLLDGCQLIFFLLTPALLILLLGFASQMAEDGGASANVLKLLDTAFSVSSYSYAFVIFVFFILLLKYTINTLAGVGKESITEWRKKK